MNIGNITAQAVEGLRGTSSTLGQMGMKSDSLMCSRIAASIESSVHFSMPDGGTIFNEKLKGFSGIRLRLPYKRISLEYTVNNPEQSIDAVGIDCPKRVIFATEMSRKALEDNYAKSRQVIDRLFSRDDDFFVQTFSVIYADRRWVPLCCSLISPTNWDLSDGAVRLPHSEQEGVGITGTLVPVMTEMMTRTGAMLDSGHIPESAFFDMFKDISSEVYALYEFCEALSCSNVSEHIERPEPKFVNERRKRKGKLPLYEMRTLKLITPSQRGDRFLSGLSAEKNPIRQHLRRGHIRRLSDNRRVWVNSCVVGSADHGVIDKKYEVV